MGPGDLQPCRNGGEVPGAAPLLSADEGFVHGSDNANCDELTDSGRSLGAVVHTSGSSAKWWFTCRLCKGGKIASAFTSSGHLAVLRYRH